MPLPRADFSEFGEVEVKPVSRVQRLTGRCLGRNWVTIPHVTHYDEVDITEVEAARRAWNAARPDDKVTIVVVLTKVLAETLKAFAQFNASLTGDGNSIVFKKYFNIDVAVDTPAGFQVPVIAGCDRKTLSEIAARWRKLPRGRAPKDFR
jgi:pyruvate dehydrogenase E2 component (dihydrolipoamide acetyltransferase)